MHDDSSPYKPLDPGRVDLLDQFERAYWCQTLRCSQEQLQQAVAEVGSHVTAVREYLASQR
jgi:Protein of unknown function (DUF3606)